MYKFLAGSTGSGPIDQVISSECGPNHLLGTIDTAGSANALSRANQLHQSIEFQRPVLSVFPWQ